MAEAAPAAPEAQPAAPVVEQPAETPVAVPAESAAQPDAQNAAEQAPAEPVEKPDTPEQAAKRGQSRFERRLAASYRREAEAKARADFLEKQLNETRQQQRPAQQDATAPKLADFNYDEDAYRSAVEKHASERTARDLQQQRIVQGWQKKVSAASEKYPDFAEAQAAVELSIPALYELMEADNGPDIMHHLYENPDEADAIAALSPRAQIRAIGRLEAKLAAAPPKPKTPSKAPAPIAPVSGKAAPANDIPQDSDSIDDWMRKERAREKRAAEAR